MNNPEKHLKICNYLNKVYTAKNQDYGESFSETYHDFGIISAVTRISDKYNRLKSLSKAPIGTQQVKTESIEDTLLDLANYCIMTLMELHSKKFNQ